MKRNAATTLLSISLIASCDLSIGADILKKSGSQLISIVEKSEKIEDSSSPVSHWEVTKRFPKLVESHPQAETVNRLILQLVEKYRCDTKGDETFTAQLTYSSQNILSFRYEAMWLCPPMWSPQSDEGAMTIDLISGRILDISGEFTSKEDRKAVMSKARKGIRNNIAAEEKANDISCSDTDSVDAFYITDSDIVFLHTAKAQDDVTCSTTFHFGKKEIANYLKTGSRLLD